MHVDMNNVPNWQDVQKNMDRLTALGLEVQITEMDVSIQNAEMPLNDKLAKQAEIYRDALNVCLENAGCTSFTTWGFTDRHTWITDLTGSPDSPLLFDENYQPKPAYKAIADDLRNCCTGSSDLRCQT